MIPNVTRYINKTAFFSIPALFADSVCRPYTLVGAEPHGLWLQSEELTRRMLPQGKRDLAATVPAAVFVPFPQITGVLVPTGPPSDQQRSETSANQAKFKVTRRSKRRRPRRDNAGVRLADSPLQCGLDGSLPLEF
jgi:hypothetical protein